MSTQIAYLRYSEDQKDAVEKDAMVAAWGALGNFDEDISVKLMIRKCLNAVAAAKASTDAAAAAFKAENPDTEHKGFYGYCDPWDSVAAAFALRLRDEIASNTQPGTSRYGDWILCFSKVVRGLDLISSARGAFDDDLSFFGEDQTGVATEMADG